MTKFQQLFQVFCLLVGAAMLVDSMAVERDDDEETDKISGGTIVPKGKHQYMAYAVAYFTDSDTKGVYGCGATVISDRHILTAAHCVKRPGRTLSRVSVNMRLYTVKTSDTNSYDPNRVRRNVSACNVRAHPSFAERSDGQNTWTIHDIAILKLNEPVNLMEWNCDSTYCHHIARVALPVKGAGKTYDGVTATAVGWGDTPALDQNMREVQVAVQTQATCSSRFGSLYELPQTKMCTYTPYKGSCSGDSGGPLVVNNVQIGIISIRSGPCGSSYTTHGYTRVSYYIDNGWIAANMI